MNSQKIPQKHVRFSPAKIKLAALILAVGIAGLFLQLLRIKGLQQTALLYIGLPTIIAAIISLFCKPKSATGMTMMAVTIGVLLSGILLQEGIICMLMALPLFYLVGFFAAYLFRLIRSFQKGHVTKIDDGPPSKLHAHVLLAVPFVLMSLEGVHPYLSFERSREVVVEKRVMATVTEVETAMAQPISFEQPLPLFLRLGFPTPIGEQAQGAGLEIGAERVIPFAMQGGEGGLMRLRVVERDKARVKFVIEENTTATADWIRLHDAEVQWQITESDETVVTWTFHYDRLLDPAWYFGPLERYTVEMAAGYLINTIATP